MSPLLLSGFDEGVSRELASFIETHRISTARRKVAVFDADGTLWRGDVGEAFFRHQVEWRTVPHAPKRDPWETYLKESTQGDAAKAYGWLAQWNAGVSEIELNRMAEEFFNLHWARNVFEPMREFSHALLNSGFEVWVISGSIRWIVQAGVKGFGIQPDRVLGSAVEVKNGILTDKVVEPIPYRGGKQKLVESVLGHAPLFAAGNTYWDKELMQTATELAMALHSEHEGEPNHESEQKLRKFAEQNDWLIQKF